MTRESTRSSLCCKERGVLSRQFSTQTSPAMPMSISYCGRNRRFISIPFCVELSLQQLQVKLLRPSYTATADLTGAFRSPSMRGLYPAPQRPAPPCARAYSNKEGVQFSSFVKCPRFKQRAWQRRKNQSRVSAFASMNAHPTRALDRTLLLRPLKEP